MKNSNKHFNSKTVTIHRAASFLGRSQGEAQAQEYLNSGKRGIGSVFENQFSPKPLTGLENWEIDLLLPHIVDADAEDRNFRKLVSTYYEDLYTEIPPTGKVLEIGLKKDNDKDMSKDNMPIEIADYIRYRHAQKHPDVAKSKKDSDSNSRYQFYMFDPAAIKNEKKYKTDAADKALGAYLQIKTDPKKVNMMLTLLNLDPRQYFGDNATEDAAHALREIAEKEPDRFMDIHGGENFDTRYWIHTAINTGVFRKVGQTIIDSETNTIIGNNEEEAIYWWMDTDSNGETVSIYKGQIQEKLTTPIALETGRDMRTRDKNGNLLGKSAIARPVKKKALPEQTE